MAECPWPPPAAAHTERDLLEIDTLATLIPWSIYPEVPAGGGAPASPSERPNARHCLALCFCFSLLASLQQESV